MNPYNISPVAQRIRYLLSDLLTGAIAFWVFNIVRFYLLKESVGGHGSLWGFLSSPKLVIEQCLVPWCLLAIYWLSGYYNHPYGKSRLQEFNTTMFATITNTVIIYLILLINDQTGERIINYEVILVLFGLLFSLTYTGRLILTSYALVNFRRNHWKIKVMMIGDARQAEGMVRKLENAASRVKYSVESFIELDSDDNLIKDNRCLTSDDLKEICSALHINQIILATGNMDDKRILALLSRLFPLDIPIKISPDTFSLVTSAVKLKDIFGEPFIDLASPSIGDASKNIKRALDVFVSILALILFSPLFGFICLIIKTTSKGPVIYRQERIGFHQKPFFIYKFRSMIVDSEPEGPRLSEKNDPRITKCGIWLRKYRLDELPQFWNVLKGEMSLVGPRPERLYYIREIIKEAPFYTLVCQVRPGITSWGMVKYGYASSIHQMVERTHYDLIYLANMSLSLDMKILLYTLKTVFSGKGQ